MAKRYRIGTEAHWPMASEACFLRDATVEWGSGHWLVTQADLSIEGDRNCVERCFQPHLRSLVTGPTPIERSGSVRGSDGTVVLRKTVQKLGHYPLRNSIG